MSRIGKQPLEIPAGVEITIDKQMLTVKGPKGSLQLQVPEMLHIEKKEKEMIFTQINPNNEKKIRAIWGTYRRLLENMVEGVTKGYEKKLEIMGVGFRVALAKNQLTFSVGYTHPVVYTLPAGIEAKVEKLVVTISGIDKQLVGEVAAQIKKIRKPDAYKGKGIKFVDEVLKLKPGKSAAKAA